MDLKETDTKTKRNRRCGCTQTNYNAWRKGKSTQSGHWSVATQKWGSNMELSGGLRESVNINSVVKQHSSI
jgi:hypothetical protein